MYLNSNWEKNCVRNSWILVWERFHFVLFSSSWFVLLGMNSMIRFEHNIITQALFLSFNWLESERNIIERKHIIERERERELLKERERLIWYSSWFCIQFLHDSVDWRWWKNDKVALIIIRVNLASSEYYV